MHVWIPYIRSGSGSDVYVNRLKIALEKHKIKVTVSSYSHIYQYIPFILKTVKPPKDAQIAIANAWNGFAFKRKELRLVIVAHHCILDPTYKKYRSVSQACYHEIFVRNFEKMSLQAADAVVAVSKYTAQSLKSIYKGYHPHVIYNGIDTEYFCPSCITLKKKANKSRQCKLLFVGNPCKRKGADLFPDIMDNLGGDYQLYVTAGLRGKIDLSEHLQIHHLNRLTYDELRQAYRDVDMLLFPSRFEGFGYAAVEAMACGTPVVASRISALPEIIKDGSTGVLCSVDKVEEFASSIRKLFSERQRLIKMGIRARESITDRFKLERMASDYLRIFDKLI